MISVVLTVAVQLAISRDGHSGGVVRTVVIRRDGAERSVITEREFVFGHHWCLFYYSPWIEWRGAYTDERKRCF